MLSIKLKPVGRKGQISYRIVVAEARSKLKGRFVEDLGWYNPYTNELKVDEEKTKKWLSSGAQATDSVYNLLVRAGVCPGPKKAVHSTKKKKTEEGSVPEGGGGSAEKAEAPKQESTEKNKEPEEKPEEPKEEPKEKESEEKKPDKETPQEEKPKKESDKKKSPEEKKSEENK